MVTDIKEAIKPTSRLVIKIGSSLLVNRDGSPNISWLQTLAADIAQKRKEGHSIIIVSSGAVALGAKKLGINGRDNLTNSQACAAVGQIILAGLWNHILNEHNILSSQLLLTLDDLEDRRRYLNISSTIERLIKAEAIPIINENDTVATNEIRYGDNDRLAARVAQASNADRIILLSDIDGLYDRNPHDPNAQIITDIYDIDDRIRGFAADVSSSDMGSGGMASKIEAARTAITSGIDMIIASGKKSHPLQAIDHGEAHSLFHKQEQDAANKGQKKWLNGRLRAQGIIEIDAGAARALQDGASLLAAGVMRSKMEFQRGDVVEIIGPDKNIIARGLSEYSSAEITLIAGKTKEEITNILSYPPRSTLVHRDHMVLI